MVGNEVFTWRGEQTLPRRACAALELLFAGGLAEICRWAADVVDIALEAGGVGHGLGFLEDRFL